ncbi:MAG: hypothetical protein JSU94_02305, partial [Phycisphaerales bacterium]
MYKKLVFLSSLALVLGVSGASRADLVGHWMFDDGSGTVAADSSGNGLNGTLVGSPEWVVGIKGGALEFAQDGSYVNLDGYGGILGTSARTIAAWVKTTNAGSSNSTSSTIMDWGRNQHNSQTAGERMCFRINAGRLRCENHGGNVQASTPMADGEWHHAAVVLIENATISYPDVILYLDGQDDTVASTDSTPFVTTAHASRDAAIGRRPSSQDRYFDGLMDDVRLYDHALTQAEIQELATVRTAYEPLPANDAQNVGQFENMGLVSWKAGHTAAWHNLYYGTTETPAFVARLPLMSTFYMAPREADTTYYWRVDEEEEDGTVRVGSLWTFSTSPEKAYNPSPADGLHYIDPNEDVSWGPAFSAVSYDVYFGTDAIVVAHADPNSDEFKGNQVLLTYDPGTLAAETTYYWRVDGGEKGDLWSFTTRPEIPITDPNHICWWQFNEGEGRTVLDWSGHGNHGAFGGDPKWVDGYDSYAIQFYRMGDEVVKSFAASVWPRFTIAFWVRADTLAQDQYSSPFAGHSPNTAGFQIDTDGSNPGNYRVNPSAMIFGRVTTDWVHLAMTCNDANNATLYYNGAWVYSGSITDSEKTFNEFAVGRNRNISNDFEGMVDDLHVYDRVLAQAEIQQLMRIDPLIAWNPGPYNGSTPDIVQASPLTWNKGDNAALHHVYFGVDRFAVEDADTSTPVIYRGTKNVGNESYSPPEALQFGRTYYWRIDEQNNDASISKGRVWRFTVADFILVDDFEDYNDYTPDRIFEAWLDGFGYGTEMIPPFYPGNGTGSAVGYLQPPFAETSVVHGDDQSMPYFYDNGIPGWLQYSEAAMTLTRSRDWTAYGVKSLSLWFRGHSASTGSFSYDQGTDTYTVVGAGTDIWDVASRDGTFHDEFHYAYRSLTGVGSIIAQVLSVENTNGWAKAGVMIRDTLDANSVHAMVVVTPSNGVAFQYRTDAGGASTNVAQGGITAPQWVKLERDAGGNMMASYSADGLSWTLLNTVNISMNTPMYVGLAVTSHSAGVPCEATFSGLQTTGSVGAVWADQDIGIQNNDPEPLYVAISNSNGTTAVVTNPDPNAALIDTWTEWNIDLEQFSGQGVNLADVNRVAIGFGNPVNPQTGGSGLVYFDDIRLYQPRCIPSLAKPANSFNNDCVVNLLDVEILTDDWLTSGYEFTVAAP